MSYLHTDVLDNGLSVLATTTVLHICSAEPTSHATAVSLSLGNKATPTVSAPGAGTPTGRTVTISAITDGAGTGNGSATHWALIDGSRLLAAYSLNAPVTIANGETFSLAAFTIRIPSPA